jgi:hypothetical protein
MSGLGLKAAKAHMRDTACTPKPRKDKSSDATTDARNGARRR